MDKTKKLYYTSAYTRYFEAKVLSCEKNNKKDCWELILDRTAFYPEGGGQPSDQGYIEDCFISDVHETGSGIIVHTCGSFIEPGTSVECRLDWDRRFDHMQQHSGEHIVSGMICDAFKCDNVGFHMGSDMVVIDYNAEITMEQLKEIEAKANKYIWENHKLVELHPDKNELSAMDYRSKKEIEDDVRIISFPGADTCACCGTHTAESGEIGLVKFVSCRKFTKGTRIELLCGKRAFDFLSMNFEQNSEIGVAMAASLDNTAAVYRKQREDMNALTGRIAELEKKYLEMLAAEYKGRDNVLIFEDGLKPDSIRRLCLLVAEGCSGSCAVFSGSGNEYKYAVQSNKAEFIKEMNSALNGRGGGRDGFAQGSVKAAKNEIESFFLR